DSYAEVFSSRYARGNDLLVPPVVRPLRRRCRLQRGAFGEPALPVPCPITIDHVAHKWRGYSHTNVFTLPRKVEALPRKLGIFLANIVTFLANGRAFLANGRASLSNSDSFWSFVRASVTKGQDEAWTGDTKAPQMLAMRAHHDGLAQ